MEHNSANPCQNKLLIAQIILKPIAYFLRFNSFKLNLKYPRRVFVAIEMLLNFKWMVPTIYGDLSYNKSILSNWILIELISKPDRTRTNNQGGKDQNHTYPVSNGTRSKINGIFLLNI